MLIAAFVLAALAAALHVYIFWMESVAWEGPVARKTFGINSEEEARLTKPLAFNQGFYNLFLALITALGVVLAAMGGGASGSVTGVVGLTLIFTGVASMAAAALVLLLSSKEHRAAALKQGTLPALALIAATVGVLA